MIWIVLIVIGFVVFKFLSSLNRDNYDLQNKSLAEKFRFSVKKLNDAAFNGNGEVVFIDKRSFNLYQTGKNQIIHFHYSTGSLTITWRFKYFQKEVVHEKQFDNVRNLSLFEQQKMADIMIKEMNQVIEVHKIDVTKGAF